MSALPFQGGFTFRTLNRPRCRFWHICHVDRHGHFALKQLRLPVLNEMHTDSYTGPRLFNLSINMIINIHASWKFLKFQKIT
jgi:hypothetical protein